MPPNLPDKVEKSRACVNVSNKDDQSYEWAVLSTLYLFRNGQRVHPYKKLENELNFSGMTLPIDPSQKPRCLSMFMS